MVRYLVSALSLLVLAGPAEAISRYNSTAMSCAAAQARIAREGAVIMRYPARFTKGLTLYDRYVTNGNLCPSGHIAVRAHIPTADMPECPVLRCKLDMRDHSLRRPWLFDN